MDEKRIEEYIEKEIKESGFPLEIMSSIILAKREWGVRPHVIFFNEDKKEYNELDIFARKSTKGIRGSKNILIIQCKKQSEKPWVFFGQDPPNQDVLSLNIVPMSLYGWFEKYFRNHYYFNKKPCSYHLPTFIKGGRLDVILEEISQVIDALLFFWEQELSTIEQFHLKRAAFFYPIIILDGRLFSTNVEPNGEVKPAESNYLQLRVTRALREPLRIRWSDTMSRLILMKDFIIDIVRKDYIEEFLKNFE